MKVGCIAIVLGMLAGCGGEAEILLRGPESCPAWIGFTCDQAPGDGCYAGCTSSFQEWSDSQKPGCKVKETADQVCASQKG